MSDYIKREDAIFVALQQPLYSVVSQIKQLDGIDIVRCRECRYCKRKRGTFKGEPIIFYRCEENNRDVESDDFCSYGERSKR
jgi:hypothetical protein